MIAAIYTLLLAVWSSQAHAQPRPLVSPGGGKTIIVWKNDKARSA